MGQKIHPNGFRLGVIRDWDAKWFATGSTYSKNLVADQGIRSFLRKRLANAAVSRIELVRAGETLNVTIHTGRPGIVIGKKGEDIERLRKEILALNNNVPVQVAVEEIRKPELDAHLVSENVCQQLEKRIMFRRAMKRAVQNNATWRQRDQNHDFRKAKWCGDCTNRVVSGGAGTLAHTPRRCGLWFFGGPHDLRRYWGQGMDFQRRDHAWGF